MANFYPMIKIFIPCLMFLHLTMANPRADLIYKSCGRGHLQNVSQFNENYITILHSMQEGMRINKFAVGEEGEEPNRVYVLAHCMNDLSKDDCVYCFSKINPILPSCFPAPTALALFDGCFMRMANYNFFSEFESSSAMMIRCSQNLEDEKHYGQVTTEMMNKLVNMAPQNDGYADEDERVAHGVSVFAMANCWSNLDRKSCYECLGLARDSIMNCLPAVEGRALFTGCFLRYADYEFTNKVKPLSTEEAIYMYLAYALLGIIVCLLASLLGYFLAGIIYKRISDRRRHIKLNEAAMESSTARGGLHFKYSMLERATESFSESNKIGQGGFGEVFKGVLPDGREIAIKRLFVSGKLSMKDVCNEVDVIGNAQHKNLVRYLGCCFTNEDTLLVYEFLPNMSLDLILFDSEKKKELDWKKRLGIIMGTAEGLEYLHRDCQVRIVHRDIKASNILLDKKHRPKISDFGLARFTSDEQASGGPAIAGTLGYMAPEYLARGRLTEKVDVYSYGVLVLEIVSGTRNNSYQPEDSLDTLVTATWRHFQENTLSSIIDRTIKIAEDIEEIVRIVCIGLLCTQESPIVRPTMTTVLQMLRDKDTDLPRPTKPPFIVDISSQSLPSHQRNRTASADSCNCYFDAYSDSPDLMNKMSSR